MLPSAQVEVSALKKITWYAVLQLANMLAGMVFFIWIYANLIGPLIGNIVIGQPPTNLLSLFRDLFSYIIVFMAIGLVIALASLLYLWGGLRSLSSIDKANFSLPTTLMLIMIAGSLVVMVGVLPYFGLFLIQISQQPVPVFSLGAVSTVALMLLLSVLILLGGLMALAGAIGGMVLGLWRVGVRYNETIIKIGAIFTIIPFLNYIAPILIIIGINSCIGKVHSLT
jgi:hypothetical protein